MIAELAIDSAREAGKVTAFIAERIARRGADGVVLGLSGGIDSAVVASLAVRAIGPEKVTALILPERDSSPDSAEDAAHLAEGLGIRYRVQDLTRALEELGCYRSASSGLVRMKGLARGTVRLFPGAARKGYLASLRGAGSGEFQEFVAFYRMKHRVRLVSLCREAEEHNLLVASCANRTELETGFFVRYGDDSGDIAPIRHLYKMQVFQMGAYLGIPAEIQRKKPSPDLFAGLKDEELMGVSYEHLDGMLICLGEGLSDDAVARRVGVEEKSVRYVKDVMEQSQKYRDAPASLR